MIGLFIQNKIFLSIFNLLQIGKFSLHAVFHLVQCSWITLQIWRGMFYPNWKVRRHKLRKPRFSPKRHHLFLSRNSRKRKGLRDYRKMPVQYHHQWRKSAMCCLSEWAERHQNIFFLESRNQFDLQLLIPCF